MEEAERLNELTLAAELRAHGIPFERQVPLPLRYRDEVLDCGYRMDLLIANEGVVEVKAIAKMEPIHKTQLLSYLRLADKRLGLLIHFNHEVLRSGIHRVVNGFPSLRALSVSALEVEV